MILCNKCSGQLDSTGILGLAHMCPPCEYAIAVEMLVQMRKELNKGVESDNFLASPFLKVKG